MNLVVLIRLAAAKVENRLDTNCCHQIPDPVYGQCSAVRTCKKKLPIGDFQTENPLRCSSKKNLPIRDFLTRNLMFKLIEFRQIVELRK